MKTEEEIKKKLEEIDDLVWLSHNHSDRYVAYEKALQWVLK